MAIKDKDIQEYKRASKNLTELGEKLHDKPWKLLAEYDLKSHSVLNCMRQERIPIGEARRLVRDTINDFKAARKAARQ